MWGHIWTAISKWSHRLQWCFVAMIRLVGGRWTVEELMTSELSGLPWRLTSWWIEVVGGLSQPLSTVLSCCCTLWEWPVDQEDRLPDMTLCEPIVFNLLHVVNVGMLILQVFSVQEYGNGSRSAAAGKSSVFWEMVFVCRKSPSRWWLYEYTSITAFPRSTKVVEVFGILSSRGGGGSIPSTVGGGICKNGGL